MVNLRISTCLAFLSLGLAPIAAVEVAGRQSSDLVAPAIPLPLGMETTVPSKKCTKGLNDICECKEAATATCYLIYDQSENKFACYDDSGNTCTPPPGR